MTKSNLQTLPAFASLNEMVEFFDTHDLGDYLEQMPETHFEVNLQISQERAEDETRQAIWLNPGQSR
jgi:hypothetical protein